MVAARGDQVRSMFGGKSNGIFDRCDIGNKNEEFQP